MVYTPFSACQSGYNPAGNYKQATPQVVEGVAAGFVLAADAAAVAAAVALVAAAVAAVVIDDMPATTAEYASQ